MPEETEMNLARDTYHAATLETPNTRIEDPGTGRKIIMRRFQFKYPPHVTTPPTKSQVLTPEYVKYLENFLWADNMEMITYPKVAYEKGGFSVFATCQAKKGNRIPDEHQEKIRPLQDLLK